MIPVWRDNASGDMSVRLGREAQCPSNRVNGRMTDFVVFKGSAIWEHFLYDTTGQSAKCRYCGKVLKISGGSTKGIHTHIKSQHPDRYAGPSKVGASQDDWDKSRPAAKRPRPLDRYFSANTEDDLDSMLARLMRDGIPFSVFCTSPDLRNLMAAKGFKQLPTGHEVIRNRVMRHCARLKCQVKQNLTAEITQGTRFSLTIDE